MSETYRIAMLDSQALAASADFYANHLPAIEAAVAANASLVVIFPPAEYDHRAWRCAAIADLARKHAPHRINAVAGDDAAAIKKAAAWLAQAPGITGQYFSVDGTGANGLGAEGMLG